MKENRTFLSDYFTIYELVDGVYAVIEKQNSEAGSNAAIVDAGDFSVIFDTFLNIDAAWDLRKACVKLTGREPAFVINSHSHIGHILGNQVFDSKTRIISSNNTRNIMESDKRELLDSVDIYIDRMKAIETELSSETDETKLFHLKERFFRINNILKAGLKIRVPDITFNGELILYGTKRNIHLYELDSAHCLGNTVVFLPDDRICLMGDYLPMAAPWQLTEQNAEKVVSELEKLTEIGVKYYVPGHGNVALYNDVLMLIKHIRNIL